MTSTYTVRLHTVREVNQASRLVERPEGIKNMWSQILHRHCLLSRMLTTQTPKTMPNRHRAAPPALPIKKMPPKMQKPQTPGTKGTVKPSGLKICRSVQQRWILTQRKTPCKTLPTCKPLFLLINNTNKLAMTICPKAAKTHLREGVPRQCGSNDCQTKSEVEAPRNS